MCLFIEIDDTWNSISCYHCFPPTVVMALNKAWCTHHFACAVCDIKMTQKTKFFEFDQKPVSMHMNVPLLTE